MPIYPFKKILPKIHETAYIAPSADIIGDVEIGAESNIWFGCVLRGDDNDIKVGARTNIQDGTVVHITDGFQGTYIGDDVTIGHMALIHACTIGNRAFVGMQACMMDGAKLEDESMLAAGALLTPGKVVPTHQLWAGRPAKYMRDLTPDEIKDLKRSADHYVRLSREHMQSD